MSTLILPPFIKRVESILLNDKLVIKVLIATVWWQEPVLVSQILTVWSHDADASSFESCEKATEVTTLLWPSSVCWRAPVLASQTLTVLSLDADASSFESCEKATELTQWLWPSSVCWTAFQPDSTSGCCEIQLGIKFRNVFRIML